MRLALVALLFLRPALLWAQEEAGLLTTTAEVRALPLEEARRHHPVKLSGTITYFDAVEAHAFLQDESGGIFFRPGKPGTTGALSFTPGERVEIHGVTWFRRFSPSVAGPPEEPGREALLDEARPVRASRLGPGRWPVPAAVTMAQLQSGAWHDQLVQLRATVRSAVLDSKLGEGTIFLNLSGPNGETIGARLPRAGRLPAEWLDVECDVQAVVGGGGNDRGQLAEVRLLLPTLDSITPDTVGIAAVMAQTPHGLGELFRYTPPGDTAAPRRVLVNGTVSLARAGEGIFLTDGTDGLWVQTAQQRSFAVGDVVSVAGYPQRDRRAPFLTDGIIRAWLSGPPPAPRVLAAPDAAKSLNQAALVAVEGEIVELVRTAGATLLTLRGEAGTRFAAQARFELTPGCEPGARLLLTGICDLPLEVGADAPAFTLRLRSAPDVSVLARAPWLTPARQRALAGAAVILSVLALSWVGLLRRQVARQTRRIEAEVIQRTLVEERARLGRELHDTLEQQLAGLHLHLGALKDWLPDAPQRVRRTLDAAARMLDHCRMEARRSVLDLRSQTIEREGLSGALRELAIEPESETSPGVKVGVAGAERRLPHTVEFHLLRCAQEALANALKHADPRHVAISLEYAASAVRLSIADDGLGFDPAQRPSPGSHLGLQHLRERAGRINGTFALDTAPGRGTTVTITAPISAAPE